MLLKEIKLLELDRTPLEDTLGKIGAAKQQFQRDLNIETDKQAKTASRSAKDVDPKIAELVSRYVVKDGVTSIRESELKAVLSTPDKVEWGIAQMINIRGIFEKMLDEFTEDAAGMPGMDDVAKTAGMKSARSWMVALQNPVRRKNIMSIHQAVISKRIAAEKAKLMNHVMKVQTAISFVQESIGHLGQFLEQNKGGDIQKTVDIVEQFVGVFAQLSENATEMALAMEGLRKKA